HAARAAGERPPDRAHRLLAQLVEVRAEVREQAVGLLLHAGDPLVPREELLEAVGHGAVGLLRQRRRLLDNRGADHDQRHDDGQRGHDRHHERRQPRPPGPPRQAPEQPAGHRHEAHRPRDGDEERRLAPPDVRIRVEAAGVNFADLMGRVGLYPDAPPLPYAPGYEVAGTVVEAGARADPGLAVGTRVVAATRFWGYADTVRMPS